MTAENIDSNIAYIDSVISLYMKLPDTPDKPSQNDRHTAASFRAMDVPLHTDHTRYLTDAEPLFFHCLNLAVHFPPFHFYPLHIAPYCLAIVMGLFFFYRVAQSMAISGSLFMAVFGSLCVAAHRLDSDTHKKLIKSILNGTDKQR